MKKRSMRLGWILEASFSSNISDFPLLWRVDMTCDQMIAYIQIAASSRDVKLDAWCFGFFLVCLGFSDVNHN